MTQTRPAHIERAAQNMRMQRQQYARRLMEARRAVDAGHPEGRARLERIRAQSRNVPNPDRRRDCARAADAALERYNDLRATGYTASTDATARYADLLTILHLTAPY